MATGDEQRGLRRQLLDSAAQDDRTITPAIRKMPHPNSPHARPLGKAVDWLHGAVLIPAFEAWFKRRRTIEYWRALERSQWHTPRQLEALQGDRLQALIAHADQTCPYYKELWTAAGIDVRSVTSIQALESLPVTNRQDRRTNRDLIRSRAPGLRMFTKGTSGSTGEPSAIDYDHESYQRRIAGTYRGYAWAGAKPGVKTFYFWGAPLFKQSTLSKAKGELYARLYRRHLYNCLAYREATFTDALESYEASQAPVIVAYTRPLYEWARTLREQQVRPTPPKSIIVGAEKLHSFQRKLIEEVFCAPVFETYGSREVMLIGAECEQHNGLHITAEHLIVELADDNGKPVPPGVEGRVLVTDLFNYGAPYIRYDIGDRAVASERQCACGRGLPLLDRVVGRQLEVIVAPDGRRIPGELFPFLFLEECAVGRFQAIQVAPARLRLAVELRQDWPEAARAETMKRLQALVGPEMLIELEIVDSIGLTPSGKLAVVQNPWLESQRMVAEQARTMP